MAASDFAIFAAFAVFLAAILIGATIFAAPIRRKLLAAVNDLYGSPNSSDTLRRRLDFFLDSAASPMVVVLLVVASVVALIDGLFFGIKKPKTEFLDDPRYERIFGLYLASIALANPLVTIIFLPVVLVCALLHAGIRKIKGVELLADAQIERVAHSRLARAA